MMIATHRETLTKTLKCQAVEKGEEDLNMNYPSKSVKEELFLPSIRTGMMTEDLAWIVLKCLGRALNFMHTKGDLQQNLD